MSTAGHLLPNLVRFGHLLRRAGIPVTPAQIADLAAALAYVEIDRRDDVKQAALALLVSRREQMALFDLAFELFWRAAGQSRPLSTGDWRRLEQQLRSRRRAGMGTVQASQPPPDQKPALVEIGEYSEIELLRHKRFADLTPAEMEVVRRLIQAMPWQLPPRRTRRLAPSPHGARLDWRRTLRHNWRFGGEPLTLRWRRQQRKPRPLVLLCDVSGSMERYSRVLLQFIYALGRGRNHVEAFVFSTRLSRITPHLRRRSLSSALDAVSAQAGDMGSGTQIGQALKVFNQDWARRVLGRGAIVVLISDGWDRGDPEQIRRQMERLQRSSHRLIWLNPLLGSPGYQPLTRGMQAALPSIDHFLPVHNLQSLEQLASLFEDGNFRQNAARRPRPPEHP